ncbi:probable sugar phosphate/phosphate translocator At1g06470 [Phoenix dactylifera]|uniref:Probable sugar phosphate/phosphate translocator At1g06470 n=1 Tax=Phoenix dactylifera TaxID=42345 RepID=A0A8B7C5S3_PHODC|nr:probable sugar phosphate/phosphate translocator At1g06470 [Phoenix dactylifera]
MGESKLGPAKGMGEEEEEEEEGETTAAAETKSDEVASKNDRPVLRREPSFSRWCKEDAIDGSSESTIAEDSDQPLLQRGGQQSMNQSRSAHTGANGNGMNYSPFDIENGIHATNSRTKLETLQVSAQSPLSAANIIKALFCILVWYTFSTCLTLYNKTLLGEHMGKFPAPLLMNTVHFTMQAVLSKAILYFQSRGSESRGPAMTWRDYFIRVVPTAIGTALDVNLSNISLVFISVTFATMCKSAAPIFLLLFAFAFRLESPSIKLLGIILIISIGVLLTVAKETEFNIWGFVFVMLAAVMSGFRWCMTQILLQKEAYGLKDPIALMSYVTPVMAVATAILSLIMDPWHSFRTNKYFDSSKHVILSCLLLLLGGFLAFFMVLTEYFLVSATSAVTITIAGIVKEAVTILVAVLYFHDQFTLLKGIGLLTIMVGVSLFNWYKYQKLKKSWPSKTEDTNPPLPNVAAKYVIIDDVDFHDEET